MRPVKEAALILAFASACSLAAFFTHPKAPSFRSSGLDRDLSEIQALPEVFWVDARSDADFESGHLDGAILLNEDRWEELIIGFLDAWPPDATTVVYCSSEACSRSHDVAARLISELEVENVVVLKGGWEALVEAGLVEEAAK